MAVTFGRGSTCVIIQVRTGVVLKAMNMIADWVGTDAGRLEEAWKNNFHSEQQILELLSPHPRIIGYLGHHPKGGEYGREGLLLTQATHGDLQAYIDQNHFSIPYKSRKRWCYEATEAIIYIHSKGVIHSDLRPENLLLHASEVEEPPGTVLCDFGGSMCNALDVDGRSLPDSGFFDPTSEWVSTHQTDIFSLGSIMYFILSGHWPFRWPGTLSGEKREAYDALTNDRFGECHYPTDAEGLIGGGVILGCWRKEYSSAVEVLDALRLQLPQSE